jgi:hypothetical protein
MMFSESVLESFLSSHPLEEGEGEGEEGEEGAEGAGARRKGGARRRRGRIPLYMEQEQEQQLKGVIYRYAQLRQVFLKFRDNFCYTVKKRHSRPQPGCLVSDIPAGDGNVANLFYSVETFVDNFYKYTCVNHKY